MTNIIVQKIKDFLQWRKNNEIEVLEGLKAQGQSIREKYLKKYPHLTNPTESEIEESKKAFDEQAFEKHLDQKEKELDAELEGLGYDPNQIDIPGFVSEGGAGHFKKDRLSDVYGLSQGEEFDKGYY